MSITLLKRNAGGDQIIWILKKIMYTASEHQELENQGTNSHISYIFIMSNLTVAQIYIYNTATQTVCALKLYQIMFITKNYSSFVSGIRHTFIPA